LSFFLPFLTISCGTNEFIKPTGIDVITSKEFAVQSTTALFPSFPSMVICLACIFFLLIVLYTKQRRYSLLLWGGSLFTATLSLLWFCVLIPAKIFNTALNYVDYNIKDVLSVNIGIGLWLLVGVVLTLDIIYLKRLIFEPFLEEDHKKLKFDRSFRMGNPFELETEYYLF
jgi:uncharacterized membrane protein YagU involved in acid resistance